jgi:N-acetylmuramoyl-L-alanine amidase
LRSTFVRLLAALVISSLVLPVSPAPQAHAGEAIASLKVVGSPFYPNGDGKRERIKLVVRLATPAALTLEVRDFDGQLVKTLLNGAQRAAGKHVVYWKGRSSSGERVADGAYTAHAIAVTSQSTSSAAALFTKAPKPIYPAAPGAITVAIDPGHGDVYSEGGRTAPDGSHEKEYNLDIGRRLQRMLQGAGVRAEISRTEHIGVNTPEWDRNEDGLVEYADELQARCDFANTATADVFISVHNNLANNPRVGGPSTYYRADRLFGTESYRLAHLVQNNMLARLDLYRTDTWKPSRSHGVLSHQDYFVLSAYDPSRRPRPTLMPGVLSEGLFLTHPYELSLLKQPRVRTSMAAAYYDAIQGFIAGRQSAARVEVLGGPAGPVAPGDSVSYSTSVTNSGALSTSGWQVEARVVPAVLLYDGSDSPGTLVGTAAVPTLGRGARTIVPLTIQAPEPGEWLLKLEVRLPDGRYLSQLGIPVVQLPLSVEAPPAP